MRIFTVLIVVFGLFVLLGCDRTTPQLNNVPVASHVLSDATGDVATGDVATDDVIDSTIVDRLDRSVRFTFIPRRVISLSPSTTELLFAIGAGPQVVGATHHCNFPPQATLVPRVGAGTLESISRETILSLKPDLVFCKWDKHQPLIDSLGRLGILVIAIGPETLAELFDEAELLGQVLGHESDADKLIESMKRRLEALTSCVEAIPESERRTVFYEVWDEPLMTAGPTSFIGEILELGAMKNIFADTPIRYPRVSAEVVVHRNPEVILAPSTHADQVSLEKLSVRQGWASVTAIREQQVFLIDGDQVSRCGPRLLDALEQMIRAVYPERVSSLVRITQSTAGETRSDAMETSP